MRFSLVPAAYLLLLRGTGDRLEVLLQLRGPDTGFMAGHWASGVAGHIEDLETVADTAVREAREELGVTVAANDVEPLCTMQRTLPGCTDPIEQRVDFFLTTRRWKGQPTRMEPEKCTGLGWFRPPSRRSRWSRTRPSCSGCSPPAASRRSSASGSDRIGPRRAWFVTRPRRGPLIGVVDACSPLGRSAR